MKQLKMKQLIITIDLTENKEMIVNTEQKNLTNFEILGILEQLKYLILSQKVEESSFSDKIEEEDNIDTLKP